MTSSELETILERLETVAPRSRLSEKRQLLSGARERILELRRRGHSWRSMARELSAAIGETVSADLLRAACVKRVAQRRSSRATAAGPIAKTAENTPTPRLVMTPNDGRFGAKGLKL